MLISSTGGVLTFSLFNTSYPNSTDYTANHGGYKIVFDNTQNQIVIYWEGSVHKTVSANVRSNDWQNVSINYFYGAISISLNGSLVLNHTFTENYQEFNSRYVGFSATAGTSHKIRNLRIHNSDKWLYAQTSNASDIYYVSGNVGIGSVAPTELLDVAGNVHISKDLTVDGNITVSGLTTFIDTTNMTIEDPIIELSKGNVSDTTDSGIVITRPSSNVAMVYRGDESELALAYTQSGASETDMNPITNGGLDVRVYGNLFSNNLTTTANVEAVYYKGDGSELTQITLDQVVGFANTTGNTVLLTNTDVGLKATGNVYANYFVGDGSTLDNISATLQKITDNSNVTTNTVQFTNTTTAFIANSNVGIGTSTPTANLHVVGYQYVNDPPIIVNAFDHSDAPLTLTYPTPTSSTAIDDPKALLHLTRDGTTSESYGAKASFKISRYENTGTSSRSRLDITLADGTYSDSNVLSLRSDGKIGVGTTTPTKELHVEGNAYVSNNISVETTNVTKTTDATSSTTGALTIAGGVGVGSNLHVGSGKLVVDTTNTGYVGINKASPAYTLDVGGDINFSGSFYQGGSIFVSSLWTDSISATNTLYYNSSNVGVGTSTANYKLHVSGDIYASGDITAFSDMRMKENIKPIENALERVKQIGGYTYNKVGETTKDVGVLAQEVMKVFPEVIRGSEDTNYSVAYGNMVAILIEAIKELSAKVDEK